MVEYVRPDDADLVRNRGCLGEAGCRKRLVPFMRFGDPGPCSRVEAGEERFEFTVTSGVVDTETSRERVHTSRGPVPADGFKVLSWRLPVVSG